ncbi:MAG: PTS sugar transporter subunit IIB [Myxococcales bacterium]|nr:PTS sugar transporter subunit IIB [Myxococcales bacterium]
MNPFYRVDNRLVHGQIIATWMPHLRLQRILIASDTVPANAMQMTLFRMVIPEGLAFDALPIEAAAEWLNARKYGYASTLVLLETVTDAARLFAAGHPFAMLNIGNVHHTSGAVTITPAVHLAETDLGLLRQLASRGMQIEVRSLPSEAPADLKRALEGR